MGSTIRGIEGKGFANTAAMTIAAWRRFPTITFEDKKCSAGCRLVHLSRKRRAVRSAAARAAHRVSEAQRHHSRIRGNASWCEARRFSRRRGRCGRMGAFDDALRHASRCALALSFDDEQGRARDNDRRGAARVVFPARGQARFQGPARRLCLHGDGMWRASSNASVINCSRSISSS